MVAQPSAWPALPYDEIMVRLSTINYDQEIQRPLSERRVRAKLVPYDISTGGSLVVNQRPDDPLGRLWSMDGHHRAFGAQLDGLTHLPARLYHLPRELEARYFVELNWASLPLGGRERYRALLIAEDEFTCAVHACVLASGFTVGFTRLQPNHIVAVDVLQRLARGRRPGQPYDLDVLHRVLTLVMATWPGMAGNSDGRLLDGLGAVLLRTEQLGLVVDGARFVQQLRVYTPVLMVKRGVLLARLHHKTRAAGVGQALCEAYNEGLSKDNRRRLGGLF